MEYEGYLNSDMSVDDLKGVAAKAESIDSVLKFARESLERLENFNDTQDDFYERRFGVRNFDIQKLKDSEKLFYEKLIENLLYIIS